MVIIVRSTGEIFVPMPRRFTPHRKVEIIKASDSSATDITSRVLMGEFRKSTFRLGIGYFKIEIVNTGGLYSKTWSGGDTIKFYADLTDATTEKFRGRIDYIKENIDKKGQTLEIEGRHISYQLTETFINKSYTGDKTIDGILKEIVGEFLTGFTYANVATFTTTPTINWSNKSFIDCVIELCELGSADGYVDDNNDFHLFAENSKLNELDALADGVPGRTLIYLKDYGEDTYYEKEKITVYGKDDEGMDIIHTAGTGTREARPIINSSLSTMEEVKAFADAKLAEGTDVPPQAIAKGYGLPYIEPGENMWIFSPRNKVIKQLKVIEIKHLTGTKVGKWFTEIKAEKEPKTIEQQMKIRAGKETELVQVINPNNLGFSYNFTFDDDTNIESHTNTATKDGYLYATSAGGITVTSTKAATNNITKIQLKYRGENLEGSTFEVSVDGGTNYEAITKDELIDPFPHTGKRLKIRITLALTTSKVLSLSMLYK